MGLFFTGKGDGGESVVNGLKIDKAGVELEALGDLDELNSLIGVVRSHGIGDDFKLYLRDVQEALFIVQANLASFMLEGVAPPELKKERVGKMEELISSLEEEVGPERNFVISGEDEVSAWLDHARAVARRAERSTVRFSRSRPVSPEVISYMNRLSSLLFAMARARAKRSGVGEEGPKYS